jgi:ABC-2 type transport system ATP-binding protein
MRRRLDLAASLMAIPPVIFLDEPTTGLDPRSRLQMWELIRDLVDGGTSILLTTQYLEEADRLANDIVIIDHGRAIARGTAEELKESAGGQRLELVVAQTGALAQAARLLEPFGDGPVHIDEPNRKVAIQASASNGLFTRVVLAMDEHDIMLDDVGIRKPTLDDVFLQLTGHSLEEEQTGNGLEPVEEGARKAA